MNKRKTARRRMGKAAATALVLLLALAGCQAQDQPSDAAATVAGTPSPKPGPSSDVVATVAGTPIPRAEFDRQVHARWNAPRPPGGGQDASATFRYEFLKRAVLEELVVGEWIEQQAHREHLSVSDAEVRSFYNGVRQSAERAEKAGGISQSYRDTLQAAHGSENARRSSARTSILRHKLVDKRVAHLSKATDDDAAEYYRSHKDSLVTKELRYVHLIVTETRDDALEAKAALREGRSWKSVSKAFSLDDIYLRHPTGWQGAIEGELAEPLGHAVFAAHRGVVGGPLHTPGGWYIFEVAVIEPARQQRLPEVQDGIKLQLKAGQFDRVWQGLVEELRERYRAYTICAKSLLIQECKNGAGAKQQLLRATGQIASN